MKKILIIAGISVGVLFAAGFGTFKVLENMEAYEQNAQVEEQAEQDRIEAIEKATTGKIGGVEYDLLITTDSTEFDVIDTMHKMTHQKVKAEDKWGALPMVPDTINVVYDIVSTSDFERKEDLLEIATRWKNGDFSKIADDHNYFWSYQGGTIGEAYGTLSLKEEKEFIKNNYAEPVANKMLGI